MTISSVNGGAGTVNRYTYNATGGETTISGTDSNGATISYLVGKEEVYVNGVLLVRTADYTASNGTSVVLVNALVAGDVIEIVTFSSFAIPTAIASSVVSSKGDLIVANNPSSVTNLPVGADGTTLVANSSASTGVSWATPVASLVNPVINGGFDIWQRSTNFSLAASTAYTSGFTADRWQTQTNANQATTISRQATGDTTNLPNIQYCLSFQRNSGQTGTSALYLVQNVETANAIPFAGKAVTFSFYARSGSNYSAVSNALSAYISTGTGTDQNSWAGYTGGSNPISGTATLTTTWQRFVFTGTIPSNATEMAPTFGFTPTGTAGTNDYYQITGVQIDLGTYTAATAPAFRRSGGTLQGELAACQRYYFRETALALYTNFGAGQSGSATSAQIQVKCPTTMRTYPTTIDYSTLRLSDESAGYAITALTINTSFYSADLPVLAATVASGLTSQRFYSMGANGSLSGYLGLGAEL